MKLKTTVRHSKSVERVLPNGLKEWVGYELIEEHDANSDREQIKRDLESTVNRWHKENNPSSYFSDELPVIQEKER